TPVFTAKKHETFYFRDEMVFFLVLEDTLFKVHSFFFERDSEYFRAMFRRHGTSSESRPIVLCNVSIMSFESFLGVLYPVYVIITSSKRPKALIMHQFSHFAQHLNDAYVAVCERPEALTKQEGERLGLDEVIKISKMRQDAR
ncbi:hypothetical protein JAAARDRAFT_100765, partial [Jaapia argillacea MUCL 33604]